MVIHYVEMDDIGAARRHCVLLRQGGEVGGEDAGGDAVVWHGRDFAKERRYFTRDSAVLLACCGIRVQWLVALYI